MKKYSILFIFALILNSCFQDLSDSVFNEDKDNPGLPEYSEWGYNTFGTYIDKAPFASTKNELPVKIISTDGACTIQMKGTINGRRPATLIFRINGFTPESYTDLKELNGKNFELTDSDMTVEYYENEKYTLRIMLGNLVFKRVQMLSVDKVLTQAILSGTFEFKAFIDDEPVSFSNGRFDLGVNQDNFYCY